MKSVFISYFDESSGLIVKEEHTFEILIWLSMTFIFMVMHISRKSQVGSNALSNL